MGSCVCQLLPPHGHHGIPRGGGPAFKSQPVLLEGRGEASNSQHARSVKSLKQEPRTREEASAAIAPKLAPSTIARLIKAIVNQDQQDSGLLSQEAAVASACLSTVKARPGVRFLRSPCSASAGGNRVL